MAPRDREQPRQSALSASASRGEGELRRGFLLARRESRRHSIVRAWDLTATRTRSCSRRARCSSLLWCLGFGSPGRWRARRTILPTRTSTLPIARLAVQLRDLLVATFVQFSSWSEVVDLLAAGVLYFFFLTAVVAYPYHGVAPRYRQPVPRPVSFGRSRPRLHGGADRRRDRGVASARWFRGRAAPLVGGASRA